MASPLAAALMMQQPIAGVPTGTVAPTDVIGAYNNYNNANMQAYAAKVAQNNALYGGLAGLGGAGILAAGNYFKPAAAAANLGPYASTADAGLTGGVGTGGFNFLDAAAGAPIADTAATDVASAAAPSVADAIAGSAVPAVADVAASTLPDWLTSAAMFLPFLG